MTSSRRYTINKLLIEFIGTFFLVIIIGMVVKYGLGETGPLVIGLGLASIVYAGYNISGAHYNPMVTLGLVIMKRISTPLALLYVLTQFFAAGIGSLFCNYLEQNSVPFALATNSKILVAEIVGTFILIFVIWTVAASKRTAGNNYYGLAIGICVSALAVIFGKSSGAVFNPAVGFSFVCLEFINWSNYLFVLLGILIGGIPATYLFLRLEED
ncbi:MAG: porin [Saprospiraceae bacterium]|nr:porin [Saprospiraceae bacterium]